MHKLRLPIKQAGRINVVRRLLPALCAFLMLGGCWTGLPWFAASEAVTVIPDGSYRLAEPGAPPEGADVLRISRQKDHSLLIGGADAPLRAIVVPLGGAVTNANRYIVQLQKLDPHRPAKAMFLMLDNGQGRFRIAVLGCGSVAAAAAERSGGSVARDPQSASTCIFGDRDTLVTTLRAAADAEPALDLELVRVDGRR